MFVSDMLNEGRAVSTVMSSLSAITFFHKLLGQGDPSDNFIMKRIIMGAQKIAKPADNRTPINLQILYQLVNSCVSVTPGPYHAIMLGAMYLLMFHAFLRVGEVTQSRNVLMLKNLVVNPQTITVTFVKFKHHTGPPVSIEVQASNTKFCPVNAVKQYIRVRGLDFPRGATGIIPLVLITSHILPSMVQPLRL